MAKSTVGYIALLWQESTQPSLQGWVGDRCCNRSIGFCVSVVVIITKIHRKIKNIPMNSSRVTWNVTSETTTDPGFRGSTVDRGENQTPRLSRFDGNAARGLGAFIISIFWYFHIQIIPQNIQTCTSARI